MTHLSRMRRRRAAAGMAALVVAATGAVGVADHQAPDGPVVHQRSAEAAPIGPQPATATAAPVRGRGQQANRFAPTAVAAAATPDGQGMWLVWADGVVSTAGDATWYGDMSQANTNSPMVGLAPTADGKGYWLLGADGGVFSFGDATFAGSTGGLPLSAPALQMAVPGSGSGYYFAAGDGGIFAFGGAPFYGSTGGMHLNRPVVGVASTHDGRGYWLVAADGGIFAFGDATFHGSTGGAPLNQPIVAMAPTPSGQGYWLVAADGGIFAFGDATFHGSAVGQTGAAHVVGVVATADGGGYWLAMSDGALRNFGDAVAVVDSASAQLAAGTGAADEYSFEVTNGAGQPVRWNPCETIHYSVVTPGGPGGWSGDVADAIDRVSAATGLRFSMDGAYASASQVPASTKLTISWMPALTGGDDVGLTTYYYILDSRWTPQLTSAQVNLLTRLGSGGGINGEEPVLLHELGHAVGLGHTPGAAVMNPVDQGYGGYQAGDITGLTRVGAGAGCGGFYS